MRKQHLIARSYLAPSMLHFYRAVCDRLERACHVEIALQQAVQDSLDDSSLLAGQVDLAFICGLPLVRLNHRYRGLLQPLAAPVMNDPRGDGRAVYFADLIVRRDSSYRTFDDLNGSRFCYNDVGSNSGHHMLRFHMLQQSYPQHFFGSHQPSGAHQKSIYWVMEGRADCAAIDSVVLRQAEQDMPEVSSLVRIVESVGPYPVPPLTLASHRSESFEVFQKALTEPDELLQTAMRQTRIKELAPVSLQDYTIIRDRYYAAESVRYQFMQ